MNRLISIIIPTFNRAKFLPKAIESVIMQSAGNWELIIIDDGSIDNTKEVVNPFLSDKRVGYIFQKNAGVAAARNKGAEISNGKYLIFLDSDDFVYPDLLESLNEVNFTKYDLICWQVKKVINGKISTWKAKQLGRIYSNYRLSFLAGSICLRKQIFINAGGYDPKLTFGENYELGMRITENKDLKIKFFNRPYLRYEIKTLKRSSNSLKNRLNSALYQYEKHQFKYENYPKAESEILYIIGYLLEHSGEKSLALEKYRKAWSCDRYNIKAMLKTLYLSYS